MDKISLGMRTVSWITRLQSLRIAGFRTLTFDSELVIMLLKTIHTIRKPIMTSCLTSMRQHLHYHLYRCRDIRRSKTVLGSLTLTFDPIRGHLVSKQLMHSYKSFSGDFRCKRSFYGHHLLCRTVFAELDVKSFLAELRP